MQLIPLKASKDYTVINPGMVMSRSAAAGASDDTAVGLIAPELVHNDKFSVQGNEATCLSCSTALKYHHSMSSYTDQFDTGY